MNIKVVLIYALLFVFVGCSQKYQTVRYGDKNHQHIRDNVGYHRMIRFHQEVDKFKQKIIIGNIC